MFMAGILGKISAIPKKILLSFFKPSPRGKIRWQVFGIFILFIVCGLISYPQLYNGNVDWLNSKISQVKYLNVIKLPHIYEWPFKLGLDLRGGSHLVYQADLSKIDEKDRKSAMEGVKDVIERRINFFGISEPIVQVAGADRLVVELAGVLDVKEAIRMIGETPLLEFKEQNIAPVRELTADEKKEMEQFNKTAEEKAKAVLEKLKSGKYLFEDLAKESSEDDKTKDNGGDLGFVTRQSAPEIYAQAENVGVGKINKELFNSADGYEIIRVDDKRDNGEEIRASHILICYKEALACEKDRTKDEAKALIEKLKTEVKPLNFAEMVKKNSDEPGASESEGDLGWFGRGTMVPEFEEQAFKLSKGQISDVIETQFGFHLIYKTDQRPVVEYKIHHILFKTKKAQDYVGSKEEWKNTQLTGANLKKAQVTFDSQTNEIQVSLEFNDEGKKLFEQITERNLGKPVAIFLDGYPISIPTVQDVIRGGQAVIKGQFTLDEAKLLAQRLNSGALPVPIVLVSQQNVGASLGEKSLQQSLYAGFWGVILIALFMTLYYRLPGFISVLALLLYGVLNLAFYKIALASIWSVIIVVLILSIVTVKIFKSNYPDFEKIVFFLLSIILSVFLYVVMSQSVTLTLAGIAGFILSLGMAVDANVLVFERIKEELSIGKPLASAIDTGFSRAWPSIQDGNFSTLITCFVLSLFGTSLIKGFAITLSLGIILSMFTAMSITKTLLTLVSGWRLGRISWLYRHKSHKY